MNVKKENKRFVIIDGNSLINRAYYAIRRPMITKDGLYTQGVYGFINILLKIQEDYQPSYLAIAFDRKTPTFRHLEFEDYKAQRKEMPNELAMQIPLLKEVLQAMKIKTLEIDGFEADDIIGTLVKRGEAEGLEPLVFTGDKDALQLASKKTKIIITKRGVSEFEIYDEQSFVNEYGFSPEQFIDYKGLMGDSSDNIPGIPGVGKKTAQKLVKEFGSVNNVISQVESISNNKLRERVKENIQLALLSRRLAEIHTDVPIEIEFDELTMKEPDYRRLIETYRKLGFNSFLKRLNSTLEATEDGIKDSSQIHYNSKTIIENKDELITLSESIKNNNTIVLKVFSDNNHIDIPQIYGIAILTADKYFYLTNCKKDVLEELEKIFISEDVQVIGHKLQSDYYALICHGFSCWRPSTIFDTAIAQYLLQPKRSGYELKTLSLEYLYIDFKDLETFSPNGEQLGLFENNKTKKTAFVDYGAQWCQIVSKLKNIMKERLVKEELTSIFYQVELPLIYVLASMEAQGFSVNREELLNAGEFLSEQIALFREKIHRLAGEEFNINSPKQLGIILFEKLKLPAGKKNKTGYSTNAEVLEKLKGKYEIVDLVLEYRTLTKLNGTYVEGMLPLIHKDEKIHAHFQQTVTATGRISCTEPNLQNIPIRQELGRKLRKAFIPEDDSFVLVAADYSQIELRVLAHMSKDPSLINAFNEGADIHTSTASKVFGVLESEVTPLQRSNAKAVNFGVIYGMSSFGLASELNINIKEAEEYINEYFKKYKKVKEYIDKQIQFCKENGYVSTIMNRKRSIPEINAKNYAVKQLGERLAMNSPIQGSAADIIKLAMIRCNGELRREKMESSLILQVHDELIIQTKKSELEKIKKLLVDNMENAIKLDVELSVDLSVGNNWYEL